MKTLSSKVSSNSDRVFLAVLAALMLIACGRGVGPARAPEPPSVPAAPPACGVVDVDDLTLPPNAARASLVRDAIRQKIAALSACSRPFRLRVDITIEQIDSGRLRARLRTVVYRSKGEVVGDIPTTLSSEHAVPEERASKEAQLLRAGADSTAQLFTDHFR